MKSVAMRKLTPLLRKMKMTGSCFDDRRTYNYFERKFDECGMCTYFEIGHAAGV